MPMPTPHHTDSYAPISYSFQYDQYGTGKYKPFPIGDMFRSLQIYRKPSNTWTGSLHLFDRDIDIKSRSFLTGTLRPGLGSRFKIKWWWQNRPEFEAKAPVYEARIGLIKPDYSTEGTGLEIDLMGATATAGSLDKETGPRDFEAGLTASQIVRRICDGFKLPVSVIQDSVGKSVDALRMGGEAYQQFIQKKILPWSHDRLNEHFEFYIDETGGVHFHTPTYLYLQGKGSNARKLAREYVAYADMVGEVESFEPSDNTLFQVMVGAGDGYHESIDSDKGKPVRDESRVEDGVTSRETNKSGIPPATPDERKVPNTSASKDGPPTAFTGWIARTPEEANRMAVTLFSRLRSIMYTASLAVKGTHDVVPLDYVGVRYYIHNGREHYMSGVFRVKEMTHDLGGSGWKTTMTLIRSGCKPDDGEKQTSSSTTQAVSPGTPDSGYEGGSGGDF